MANVPLSRGPSVSPDASPLRVAPSPDAFGANVLGQALTAFGKTEAEQSDRLAQTALQMAAIDNKARVDEATVNLAQAQDKFVLDYQTNNRGMRAYDNLTPAMEELEAQRKAMADAMPNPAARAAFQSASRVATLIQTQSLSRFAATERRQYILETNAAKIDNLRGQIAGDPNAYPALQDQINQELAFRAHFEGWSEDKYRHEVQVQSAASVGAVVEQMAINDPEGADRWLGAHRAEVGEKYTDMKVRLQPAIQANQLARIGRGAVDAAIGAAAGGQSAEAVWKNIIRQESGGRPGVLGPPTPYGRAEGLTQMLPQTAEATAKRLGIAWQPGLMRGTSPEAAAYQERLGRAYFGEGLQRYGGDVAKAAAFYHGGPDERMWGPKTRAYVAAVTGGGGAGKPAPAWAWAQGASTTSMTGGPPTSVQLQSQREEVAAYARAEAERTHPGNAAFAERAEANALGELNQRIGFAKGTEADAYQAFGAAIEGGNIETEEALMRAVPGGVAAWNSLPFGYQQALRNAMKANANEMTPARQAEWERLTGLRADNNAAFQQENIESLDLPWSVKKQMLQAQATDRRRATHVTERSNTMRQLISFMSVRQAMHAAKLQKGGPEFNQFTGALLQRADEWQQANPGKKIDEKTVAGFANEILAPRAHPAGNYLFGIRVGDASPIIRADPTVTPALREQIISRYTARHGRPPQEWEIGYAASVLNGR